MVSMVNKEALGGTGNWSLQSDYQKLMTDSLGMSTPEWMVQIGDGFEGASTIAGDNDYTTYMELLKWEGRSSRDVRGLTGSQMYSSASLKHSNMEIHIPTGDYLPTLETNMYRGTLIPTITFIRLSNSDDTQLQEIQKIEFGNCYINFFKQSGDVLIIAFRFLSKDNTFMGVDQLGQAVGEMVSSVDFSTGIGSE